MDKWTPKLRVNFELPETLKPLSKHEKDFDIIGFGTAPRDAATR